jgi:hypothetical protein
MCVYIYIYMCVCVCVSVLHRSDNSLLSAIIIFVGLDNFHSVNFCTRYNFWLQSDDTTTTTTTTTTATTTITATTTNNKNNNK